MAASIAYSNLQYEDNAGWYLKAYEPNTTTPKIIYFDKAKSQSFAKVQLDTLGFPESTGGTRFIPFIEDFYDLWLFPTADEADEDDTANAIRMAINITAESFDENDIPDASTTSKGVTEILTTSEALIYTAERYNGFPLTPIQEYVVTNSESSYSLTEELLNLNRADAADIIAGEAGKLVDAAQLLAAGGGGGSSADIGDTILKDKTIGDADTDLITQLGTPFDPITYPVLAANPDYNKGKTLLSVNSASETVFISNVKANARYIRISPTVYYAFAIENASIDSIKKSIDGGVTWSNIPALSPLINNWSFNFATFDNVDTILFFSQGTVALFSVTSETFLTGSISLSQAFSPVSVNYNNNIGKWVVFANDTSPDRTLIYSSADGITWDLEYERTINTDLTLQDKTYGIPVDNNMSYFRGFYYIVLDKQRDIFRIPETDLRISNEYVVDSSVMTQDAETKIGIISISETGQMAYPASYSTVSENGFTKVQIRFSNDGFVWENRHIELPTAIFDITYSEYLRIVPVCHNTFLIASGNSSGLNEAKAGFVITNNNFDSYIYEYTASNTVFSYFYKIMSLIFEPTTSKLIINLPSGNLSNAECKNLILDLTLSASDIYENKKIIQI